MMWTENELDDKIKNAIAIGKYEAAQVYALLLIAARLEKSDDSG